MKTLLKVTLPAALLMAMAVGGAPLASAQSDGELADRVGRMEDQLQQLMGQVEQLTFEVRRLQGQRKSGDLGEQPAQAQPRKRQLAVQDHSLDSQGVEQVGDTEYTQQPLQTIGDDLPEGQTQKAPGPKILGTIPSTSYQQGNNGYQTDANSEFQGQVLVPPGGGTEGQVLVPPASVENGGGQVLVPPAHGDGGNDLVPEKVETVALGAAASADPEVIYERSYESLLRRQFGDAEVGFRGFLEQHRDHSLAGNAQYWLGETYYVQGDYKQAAQAFLSGYRDFPKSRKAADSLLKLGLSLNRLGQKEQACAAYMQVSSQFPKAAEAKKRAQSEIKRAGC
ncbi:tol-pal system protein YbgF [Nordella sp. HKS 07]|uniref:tol-pal system protein YbgF n=1 Tax=Nordella sp. HKS 07 TaxID=2712222 RepID=UPI0013E12804|nr:tol-pal system protein YbgF [Nordella sp. HKS 07]QIG46863.1 tol-pal system protein YbgF [Nordella sp. HKS 07]